MRLWRVGRRRKGSGGWATSSYTPGSWPLRSKRGLYQTRRLESRGDSSPKGRRDDRLCLVWVVRMDDISVKVSHLQGNHQPESRELLARAASPECGDSDATSEQGDWKILWGCAGRKGVVVVQCRRESKYKRRQGPTRAREPVVQGDSLTFQT